MRVRLTFTAITGAALLDPSSSPYVVAVGGTTLTGQATQPLREIAWIGGGGGYSVLEHAAA